MKAFRVLFFVPAAGLLLAGMLWAGPASGDDSDAYFFDITMGDFTEELELAQEDGKKGIMLFFEEEDCPYCLRMKEKVFNKSEVQEFYGENFLKFSVDVAGDVEMTDFHGKTMRQKDFSKISRVRATPVFVFYDLKGKEVMRYIGATSVEDFLLLGGYVVNGIYEEMPFLKYKRKLRGKR